jgi:hypothetical protein
MGRDVNEVLSAFVDGERFEPADLATALAEPGARELLVEFVRLRMAVADDSRPAASFAREMRERLGGGRARRLPPFLRGTAAAAVLALAAYGAFDLGRLLRRLPPADEPPPVTRVIRFEPGVDWMPVPGR